MTDYRTFDAYGREVTPVDVLAGQGTASQRLSPTAPDEDDQEFGWSEPCDECEQDIPGGSGVSRHHARTCSLYPAERAQITR